MLYCHVQLSTTTTTYVHISFSPSLLLPSFESDEVRFNLMALVTDHKLVYQRQMKAIQERVEAAATKVGRLDRRGVHSWAVISLSRTGFTVKLVLFMDPPQ